MSLVGSRFELGGHTWRVTSVLREGPAWRVVMKAAGSPESTMTVKIDGTSPPGSLGPVRDALQDPEARSFADEGGARWKAELVPQWQDGRFLGRVMILSATGRSARFKVHYTALASLAVLTDGDLRQWLAAARRTAAPLP